MKWQWIFSSTCPDHFFGFPLYPPKNRPHRLSLSLLFHLIFLTWSGMHFLAFVSINIAVNIENVDISFPLSKATMCFFTASQRYAALRDRITPWCTGWVITVVFGRKKINSTHLRFSTFWWSLQLSTIKATFRLSWILTFGRFL